MALSLDGHATGSASSLVLTTANAGDVIILSITYNNGTITGVSDTAGLVWHHRASSTGGGSGVANLDEWWAIAPSALSSDTITWTSSGSNFGGTAFGVSGANTSAPFDTNVSLPGVSTGTAVTISTTSANTFVFGLQRANSSPGACVGLTLIGTDPNFDSASYVIESSAQSGLSVASASGSCNGLIVDAITAASGTTYSFSLSDTAATSDTFSEAMHAAASLSDTSATSDSLTPNMISAVSISDMSATSDALTPTMQAKASLADTVATSDSLSPNGIFQALFSDIAATSDILTPNGIFPATFSDTCVTGDNYAAGMQVTVGLLDTAATLDSFAGSGIFPSFLTDSIVTSDTFSGIAIASISDGFAAGDVFGSSATFAYTLHDTVISIDVFSGGGPPAPPPPPSKRRTIMAGPASRTIFAPAQPRSISVPGQQRVTRVK